MQTNINNLMNLELFEIIYQKDIDINIAELIQNLKNSKIKNLVLRSRYTSRNYSKSINNSILHAVG